MNIREDILKEEAEFPKLFSSYVEKDFGILFYMEDNKELHDGNHAVIYPEKITDLNNVLNEITDFYMQKGITPTIYHPFTKNYFAENKKQFDDCGYTVEISEPYRFMLLNEKNTIQTKKRLDIKRVTEWDERIANDIIIPCGELWEIEPTKIALKNKENYLFAGYLDGKAVLYTTLHESRYGCTRFDYILTSKEFRKNGYAREMVSYVVEYCKSHHMKNSFQWAGPSEKITYEAGFREVFWAPSGYATYTGQ